VAALILVVDDDEAIRTLISEALHQEGYLVAHARHGVEALALLTQVTPSGVIMDLTMPVMDGLTLLRELHTRGLRIPCLVATATTLGSTLVGDPAVAAVVPKPVVIDALLALVREHCGPAGPAPDG
jgi:two-component system response regulator MprA